MREISERTFRMWAAALSFATQIGASLQLGLTAAALRIPARWVAQFTFVLAVAAAITFALPFLRPRTVVYAALAARYVLIYVAGIPLGGYLGVETTLLSGLVLEAFAHGAPWPSAAFTAAAVTLTAVSQQSVNAWGEVLPSAAAHDLLATFLQVSLVAIAMAAFRVARDRCASERDLYSRLNDTALRLADANMKLQEYAALKEEEATRSERKRVAQEIHDTLAYTLTNLIMMMEAGLSLAGHSNDELQEVLSEARTHAKEGLGDVRRAIEALQPSAAASTTGLRAIHNLVQSITRATGVHVELHLGDVPWNLGQVTDQMAFRLVQESITNALRHGRASQVSVFFARSRGGVQITLRDNGVGSEHVEPGFGLKGMQERIGRLGGRMSIFSQPGRGFRVEAWVPLAGEQDCEEDKGAAGR